MVSNILLGEITCFLKRGQSQNKVKYGKKLIVPCERVGEEGYIEWSHLQMHRLQSKDHITRMHHSLGVKRVKCPFQCFKYCSGYLFVVFLMYQRGNLAYSLEYT